MAKSIKEIGKKAENLIEQGKEADKKIQGCQARVAASSSRVVAARRQLADASETDDEGNPRGDVDAARVQLSMVQNQLAASQRALSNAQSDAERIKQQKSSHVREIEKHNQVEKNNLEKLKRLRSSAFGSDSRALTEGMTERLNEAEESRVALLKSMGIDATPEYVSVNDATSDFKWEGGNFSAIDNSGQLMSYQGGSNEGVPSVISAPTPIGGALSSINNAYILGNISGENENQSASDVSITDNGLTDGGSAIYDILQDESMSISDRINALNELKETLLNANNRLFAEQEMRCQREYVKVLKLSDHERYVMGLRYIDDMLDVYRDNLHNYGVDDGAVMDRYLAIYKSQYLKLLSDDIQNGTYTFYYHEIPDFELLAEKIKADQDYVPKYLITDKQRESIREGIRKGVVTEKDIRDIGRNVRERYDIILTEKHREYDAVLNEQRNLAIEAKKAKTPEERERIEVRRRILVERENNLATKYRTADMVRDVLSKYRDIGPQNPKEVQPYQRDLFSFGIGGVVKAIDNVRDYIPSDWVEKSNRKPIDVKHVSRGYFLPGKTSDIVALSGGKEHMQSCAFHEMGHRFENMYPEILKIEKQFYDRRTANETLEWLGPGYDKSEVTRYDNFISPYMGKDYGGLGYELLSMGMEGMFCETFNISRDSEYEDMILGILVAI